MKLKLILIFFAMLFPVIAAAGWQADIAENQNRTANYIAELQINANAMRPKLIQGNGLKSQQALRECNAAMDRAEKFAKAGRPDLIQMPTFSATSSNYSSNDRGSCAGDCASEQGICISNCRGDGQCINRCGATHGRCIARCN